MRQIIFAIFALLLLTDAGAGHAACQDLRLNVVVLGSGGPEAVDGRVSSSYLLREGEKALFLIDLGPGAMSRFAQVKNAQINDLQAVLFTHLHVDHSADFPALIKASYFEERQADLPVYGPSGNKLVPDVAAWVQGLFAAKNGVYRYLSEYVDESTDSYQIKPHVVAVDKVQRQAFSTVVHGYTISAMAASHGPIPALSWRIERQGCAVTFSGDTNNSGKTLERLAAGSNLLVAHNAVPEQSGRVALNLHMPPSEIGRIAAAAKVKRLLLSHLMRRTENRQDETKKIIEQFYQQKIEFAKDLGVYQIE